MKILLIHRAFAMGNEPGGTRHLELGRALAAHNINLAVITAAVSYTQASSSQAVPPAVPRESIAENIDVIRCDSGTSGVGRMSRLWAMLRFMFRSFGAGLREKDIDLVWATSPTIFQAVASAWIAALRNKPFFLEVRDIWPDALVDLGAMKSPLAIRFFNVMAHWLYRHAKLIIINSPGFKEPLIKKGVPDSKIVLVQNGVDVEMFDPKLDSTSYRKEMGWEGRFVALYSGAHGIANDLGVLLDAAKSLGSNQEILIVFVGDGPEKPRLMAKAKEMKLENVQFLNPVPKKQMPLLLAATQCCIAHLKPSPMQAMVYPNKVFDYMAAGKPTVLGIGGVIKEVITAAQGGLTFEPGDSQGLTSCLLALAKDRSLADTMGLNARSHVERHFDRNQIALKLLDAVNCCLRHT